jgi:hypothetical protein
VQKTWKPSLAGALIISSGILGIFVMLTISLFLWAMGQGVAEGYGSADNISPSIFIILGVAAALPGLVAVGGGILCIQRRKWGLALAGAIAAIIYLSVLGIPALVFLITSREEFRKAEPARISPGN